jgi:hypothetical protein
MQKMFLALITGQTENGTRRSSEVMEKNLFPLTQPQKKVVCQGVVFTYKCKGNEVTQAAINFDLQKIASEQK